jgi:hypothetical protein
MAMLLAVLAALAAAAGAFALRAFVEPDAFATAVKTEWRPPAYAAGAPSQAKPASADAQTLNRPIFFKSRRPFAGAKKDAAPAAAPRPEETAPPDGLSLGGIAKFGREQRAFIVTRTEPEGKWFAAGETVDDWTVADIKGAELTLKNGSRTIRLQLYPHPAPEPPPENPF